MDGNPPNHFGDLKKGIRIRAIFSKGQCGPCVMSREGGLKEGLGEFYSIWNFGKMKGEWKKMYVLVWL